jgi:hypothetical protein
LSQRRAALTKQNGVGYIAQVLKRNRTLKVLNLSDNKIDATGLAALAEALKYNSSLETLDMSSNPCCVTLEGVRGIDCVESSLCGGMSMLIDEPDRRAADHLYCQHLSQTAVLV